MKQKHGGPRPNSGRKLKGAEKMTQRTITMEPSTWRKLDLLRGPMTSGDYIAGAIVADWVATSAERRARLGITWEPFQPEQKAEISA